MAANLSLEPTLGVHASIGALPIWRRIYRRIGAPAGFVLAATLLSLGWTGRNTRELSADEGLGYLLGIVAVACMLVLLLYPLRKRLRFLKLLGPVRNWFRFHMMMGVACPLAALYHCNFTLGSINSRVALYSALLVAGSGLIGRFLYSKIHHGLYGRKADLKELLAPISAPGPEESLRADLVPELMIRLSAYDQAVVVAPKGTLGSIGLLLRLIVVTRLEYRQLKWFIRRRLIAESICVPGFAEHHSRVEKEIRRFVAKHLRQVRRVAEFNAYERLFRLWHVVHLPFFMVLIISAVIHIWAVHAY